LLDVDIAVIGAGPAGLMAAQVAAKSSTRVHVFDAMPSVGRKFLLAGIGGLNLTHAEPFEQFVRRYHEAQPVLLPLLNRFGATQLRHWAHELGVETFVGSSQRVFPKDMKAAPLLRSWLARLKESGIHFHARHRWQGWASNAQKEPWQTLKFEHVTNGEPAEMCVRAKAVVLALGGGSWSKLGSDGAWVPLLEQQGVEIEPLVPSNCGFEIAGGWSEHLKANHAGAPLKNVRLSIVNSDDRQAPLFSQIGECVISDYGLEGSLIYAASKTIRNVALYDISLNASAKAIVEIDLLPNQAVSTLRQAIERANGKSLSSLLESRFRMDAAKRGLFMEARMRSKDSQNQIDIATLLKAIPIKFSGPRPIDEAISTAGGVRFCQLNDDLMSRQLKGVFFAGEMLDWEAPTGGYLLTACFATGLAAGEGAAKFISRAL
jgi:uncharacterized flavoprotein (TIGR03862 family)